MPNTGPYDGRRAVASTRAAPPRAATLRVATLSAATPRAAMVGAAVAAGTLLAGCAGTVDIEPAPEGASVECRDFVASLPSSLADLPRRGADATAGVAAWGDPAVVLRCGVEPLGPTTLPCVTIDGVDWIVVAQGEDGSARLATFGRDPAVEVEVPSQYAPAPPVLTGLGKAVGALPVERACV